MLNRDLITGIILLVVCAFSWQKIANISKLGKFFPQVCIVILAFFSVLLILRALKVRYEDTMFSGINLKFVRLMVLGFLVYVASIFFIGFYLASFIFLTVFGVVLDSSPKLKAYFHSALISFCATTIFYVIFKKIFSVPLPPGMFFGG